MLEEYAEEYKPMIFFSVNEEERRKELEKFDLVEERLKEADKLPKKKQSFGTAHNRKSKIKQERKSENSVENLVKSLAERSV